MSLLQKMDSHSASLNNALLTVYDTLRSEAFSDYLVASGLQKVEKVTIGYPNGDPNRNEIYVNTSSDMDCIDVDLETGLVGVTIVVDFFIADDKLPYIWKYSDATRQWITQFKIGLALLGFEGRVYAKATGSTANHFTLSVDVIADILNDYTAELKG